MTDSDSTKRCNACGRIWPKSPKYFHRRRATGYQSRCKACVAPPQRAVLVLANMMAPSGFKVCSKCEAQKPLDEFHSKRGECKACQNQRWRGWADRTRDELNERRRATYREDHERIREQKRVWREANAEIENERTRDWFERNPEYRRKYAKANRERVRGYVRKRRASLKAAPGDLNADTIWQMYDDQGGVCAYCEAPLFGTFDVDHMTPLSRAGSNEWWNIAVACPGCNRRKNARTAEEFMAVIRGNS